MKEKGEKMTKRIVVLLGGVLLSTVPAMANDYYQANGTGYICDGDGILSGLDLNETNVTMLAQYAPHCTAGNYLVVDANNPNGVCTKCYDSENPNATTNLATGTYCPSMTSVTLNSDGMPITQGWDTCPLGYRNGDSASSVNGCVKFVTCPTNCSNLNSNNYSSCTITDNRSASLTADGNGNYPTTFRDVNAYCFETATHADGYSAKNIYGYLKENPQVFSSWSYCSIDGTTGNCDGANAMERGTWVINAANTTTAPIKAINGVAVCSNAVTIGMNDASTWVNAGSDFNGNSTGTLCWLKSTDWANQKWFFNGGMFDSAEECAANCGKFGAVTGTSIGNNPFGYMGTDPETNNPKFIFYAGYEDTLNEMALQNTGANIFVANPITVSWKADVAGNTDHLVNECTYGGGLTAPLTPPQQEGYTFLGWKVQE